jgi:hypothetical protein
VSATTQAVLPTARSMAWTPVAVTVVGLVVVATLVRLSGREAPLVLTLGIGTVAALGVFALRDPASALLAAVPVSAWRRRWLRLGWVVVVVLPTWLVVAAVLPGPGAALPALLALTSSALAVAVWLPGDDPGRAAALPMAWAAAAALLGGVGGPVAEVATWWVDHPWSVTGAAALALAAGWSR